jgi:hypothetical protein
VPVDLVGARFRPNGSRDRGPGPIHWGVSAKNPLLVRFRLRLTGKSSADPRDVHRRLQRALARVQADGGHLAHSAQVVGELHTSDSYRRWRQSQLRRLPGAFVPEAVPNRLPMVMWAFKPAGAADFLRSGHTKALLSAPVVSFFLPAVDGDVALAGMLAGWLEQQPGGSLRLAPPLLRHGAERAHVVLSQYGRSLPAAGAP